MNRALGFLLALFVAAGNAYAGSEGGPFTVASLRVGKDGVYAQLEPPPVACGGGSQYRMHARVRSAGHENFNAITSTLLTAYTSGDTLRWIWFSDLPAGVSACSSATGEILELFMVELAPK